MRGYFPFTDFEFYAYVVSGLVLLVTLDYSCTAVDLLLHWNWQLEQAAVVIAISYVTGMIVAMLAASVLETQLFKRTKRPSAIMLGYAAPGGWEKFLTISTGTSYFFSPLSDLLITKAKRNAAAALGCELEAMDNKDRREDLFQYGFFVARRAEDSCRRIDRDRREYEFSRNMAVVSFISAVALYLRGVFRMEVPPMAWALAATLTSIIMFLRYVRYYGSFHSQVIRAAAFADLPGENAPPSRPEANLAAGAARSESDGNAA